MDPKLVSQFLEEGSLPNFQKLIQQGDFKPLQTSMPPLSPVAWSTFITGMDPGGHGIYDFIHRNPKTLEPELSISKAIPPSHTISFGKWEIPTSSGRVDLMRKGKAFWQILEEEGIPTVVYRMPANFPPAPSKGKSLSGMGTPDILGTPGTFSLYTAYPPFNAEEISGGRIYTVEIENHKIRAQLRGPKNSFRKETVSSPGKPERNENPDLIVDFEVYLDPEQAVARISVQDQQFILAQGEWSDWVRIDFQAVPALAEISAIARFYLQEVRPNFRLYVTPLQINPEEPAMPISTPSDWSHQLCEELGYFYTQELPEDTKAFTAGVFTGREFWEQSQFVFRERSRAFDKLLNDFQEGLLFFYYSSLDQGTHMLWHYMDDQHPVHQNDHLLSSGIRKIYQEIDEDLGKLMDSVDDDTTIIVMSDHGFAPFYWQVNLNSWLAANGWVKLKDPSKRGGFPQFQNVDWTATKAYALGLNGVYLNLKGREPEGIVEPSEYDSLLDQLENELLEMRDPRNDNHPISLVVQSRRDLHGPLKNQGPDMIIGYSRGYRSSWESPLGEFPRGIFLDNEEVWSGDHCVDYRVVPGVLITNRKIILNEPALYDLTVAVLDEYGIKKLPEMLGKDCLSATLSTD
jgi:predicted AlkP superfamily phosphohydrolase/phosphomutase